MKLSQILNAQVALKKLLGTSLPVKIAYKLSKIVNKMQPDLVIYEEQRTKLVKDMGEEKEGGSWSVKTENLQKFAEDLNKLQDIDVNLEFGPGKELEKIKIEDLGDIKIEAGDLVSLDWLFE